MKQPLTDQDKSKIKKLNLFRLSNDWYLVLSLIGLFYFALAFFLPYTGWRHKPINPPTNTEEYVKQVIQWLLPIFPLCILSISNYLVKRVDRLKGYKKIDVSTVKLKIRLFGKLKLIIFKPFLIIIYFRPLQFHDLEKESIVKVKLTYFRRLIEYELI
ncbi:hypothetical protein FA048_18295 [Pedobacter polaris]|uniref:Uncharacterized protein n=1 Tax=Pedobacter polaris TaxID=2571273 RepID=A0A4U1CJY3_9SPHI|nr:hypothetical protein [Pedobacter polaris]TKC05663.1 hypothetical protein FA048_18295 [Pedobacter polaris]